jgi:hypothetical protein
MLMILSRNDSLGSLRGFICKFLSPAASRYLFMDRIRKFTVLGL